MSDLVGNHIVCSPTRRLIRKLKHSYQDIYNLDGKRYEKYCNIMRVTVGAVKQKRFHSLVLFSAENKVELYIWIQDCGTISLCC